MLTAIATCGMARSLSTSGGRHRHRVGAFSALPVLIRQFGADPLPMLESVGLAEDALDAADGMVPFASLVRLLHGAAVHTRCAHFGLLAGRMWRLDDLPVVGNVMRNAPTVGEALRAMALYQRVEGAGGVAFMLQSACTVDVGYAIYDPEVQTADQFQDAILAGLFNVLRELCGPAWLPSDVFISHARPLDVSAHRAFFKVQPRFNAEFCALRFPARWLEREIPGHDPVLLGNALQRVAAAGDVDLVDRVARALRVLLLDGKSSGDDVARALSMHRRTLNRRLQEKGTTFQHVLDEVRFNVARQLLADSDIALDDVAATLGYAGVSPFMRTFRRWTGTTPGRWRRSLAAREPTGNATMPRRGPALRVIVPALRHPRAA